jgi:hypothetical protein
MEIDPKEVLTHQGYVLEQYEVLELINREETIDILTDLIIEHITEVNEINFYRLSTREIKKILGLHETSNT